MKQFVISVIVVAALSGLCFLTWPSIQTQKAEHIITNTPSLPYGWTVELVTGEKKIGKVFFEADNVVVVDYRGNRFIGKSKEIKALYPASTVKNNGNTNGGRPQ